ncbi:MAG: ABC transporter ATP-binding protein/permease [Defluviitaleaceae bacterium]|nr:ABC transporter ATP-binding protein/permease [Defluviitaleaceae bacterium]
MFDLIKYISKKNIISYVLVIISSRTLFILSPLFLSFFINSVVDRNLESSIFWAVVMFAKFFWEQINNYCYGYTIEKSFATSYYNIFNKINNNLKSYDIKNKNITEIEIQQQLGQNYENIEYFIFYNPIESIAFTLQTIVTLIVVFSISPFVALTMFLIVPISIITSNFFGKKLSKASLSNLEDMEQMKDFINDSYKLSKEDRFLKHKQMIGMESLLKRFMKNAIKKIKIEQFYNNILIYSMMNFAILVISLISGYLVFTEVIYIGSFFAFTLYTSHLWRPIEFLMQYRKDYFSIKPALDSFKEFLNLEQANFEKEKIENLSLDNFISLGENNSKLHKPLNIEFEKNKFNIIAGENGTGKTTIVEAILNFNSRFEGSININNKNKFFDDMVYISAKPYISKFGNLKNIFNGSYGQQKIAQIEFAIKTEKSVYIFDEPTNYLDKNNKEIVIKILENLVKKDKILIIVSHDEELINHEFSNVYRLEKIMKPLEI